MKRLLLVLVLAMMLVSFAGAVRLDFQDPYDMNSIGTPPGATRCQYRYETAGGNGYVYCGNSWGFNNTVFSPFTYASITQRSDAVGIWSPYFTLRSNTGAILKEFGSWGQCHPGTSTVANRHEINIVAGAAYYYVNGVFCLNTTPMASNPYSIDVSDAYGDSWALLADDFIVGDLEEKTVLGVPDTNTFYFKKDIVNPAASGYYFSSNGTLISSTLFTTTFSRSNLTGTVVNEPIYLINQDTGSAIETEYTGAFPAGTTTWHINNFTGGAPYGFYQVKLGTTVSDAFAYIANGANIYFDKADYSTGDTATITYLIDAGYYDTSTYTYSIKVVDVYGSVIDTQNIATASGSVSYTWTPDNTQGVYYAEIIGTPNAGGSTVLYNYDYATLSAYFDVTGYVHDAETELPISGALVNASQGNIRSNATSGADGSYTVSGFLSGVPFGMNTSATSHQGYWNNFTPITSHTLHINVTLIPSSPTLTGITLGGVCRDTTYGRPISACSVDIWNATSGEYFTKVANSVGFYNKTMLTESNQYSIEGMKLRYQNSTIYRKTAVRA